MIYYGKGSETTFFSENELKQAFFQALDAIGQRNKILIIPPDSTRSHSFAGELTSYAYEFYGENINAILPALGTHEPMSPSQISRMFPNVPQGLFRQHDWRNDVITLGKVPAAFVNRVSEGKLNFDWPAQVNKLLVEGDFDLILSIGQVVPHEVIGMANFNKNIFVGTGGAEGINKSHYIGAVYGMERIMGRAQSPVREVLNYASENFAADLPVVYAQTVVSRNPETARLQVNGLFVGNTNDTFEHAAALSQKVNFRMLEKPLKKVVVYLEEEEFKSTWLGNKSIYRTRMAIADGGELIVLAPGLKQFGEDHQIDRLIRKYGYTGTPNVLAQTRENKDLQENLSAAAHLIHGSSEGRFSITYCPGHLTRQEIENVNFDYANLSEMLKKYPPEKLSEGFNTLRCGEEIFYIPNPALGLWASRERFEK